MRSFLRVSSTQIMKTMPKVPRRWIFARIEHNRRRHRSGERGMRLKKTDAHLKKDDVATRIRSIHQYSREVATVRYNAALGVPHRPGLILSLWYFTLAACPFHNTRLTLLGSAIDDEAITTGFLWNILFSTAAAKSYGRPSVMWAWYIDISLLTNVMKGDIEGEPYYCW